MNALTFQRVERFSDEYPVPAYLVSGLAPCGHAAQNCAVVLEPDSPNLCLLLTRPLGFNLVQLILDMFDCRDRWEGES